MKELDFGSILKRLRLQNGLKQKAIAEKIGVHVTSIKNWENGSCYPDAKNICILADFFHITSDALLGREGIETISLPEMSVKEQKQLFCIIQAYIDTRPSNDNLS